MRLHVKAFSDATYVAPTTLTEYTTLKSSTTITSTTTDSNAAPLLIPIIVGVVVSLGVCPLQYFETP